MKIIIVGPAQSGKTTLLHKVIRTNPGITFSIILDGIEGFAAAHDILPGIPANMNYILTTCLLANVPPAVQAGALILDVPTIRGLPAHA